jgi:rhamnosyltransferase
MSTELSKSTLAVIVTYNPETKLLTDNLIALSGQFPNILITDNGSRNIKEVRELVVRINPEVKIVELKENMGIAYAQNQGLKEAAKNHFDWLLTMDQDSVIPDNLSSEYTQIIDKHNNIGLIGWNQRPKAQKSGKEIIRQDWFVLSSGCLLSTKALNECGGFDEKLFIDHVDTDVNIKIRNLGYKTLTTNKVILVHELGTKTTHKTILGNPYIAHSPTRIYYNVRNGVVLFRRYFFKQPGWTLIAIVNCVREGIYLLLYQSNKSKNFLLLLRAWREGIFNKLGKYQ